MLALWVQAVTSGVKATLDKEVPKSSRELRELVVLAGMSMVGYCSLGIGGVFGCCFCLVLCEQELVEVLRRCKSISVVWVQVVVVEWKFLGLVSYDSDKYSSSSTILIVCSSLVDGLKVD